MKILLASGSPRRKQLLEELGHEITVISPDFDEGQILIQEPAALVAALAEGKGRSVKNQSGALLVAADTVVAFQGKILGKPASAQEAEQMLCALSGNVHEVYTGVYLEKDGVCHTFTERSEVHFRPLSAEEITAYIATGKPMDKAGSYGIQETDFVCKICGSYHNIMGFPTEKFEQVITQLKG